MRILGVLAAACVASFPAFAQPAANTNGIAFGVATVTVAIDGAYICLDRNALAIAGDESVKERIGELNYIQTLVSGGCVQVERGTTLTIRAMSDTKSEDGLIISPRGKIGRMRDFTDWFGKPLVESSLHYGCRTVETAPITVQPNEVYRGTAKTCGLEY